MDIEALCAHAASQHRGGNTAEAEKLYGQVLAAAPTHFVALNLLGVLRAQQGRGPEALELMAAALKSNPNSATALFNYGVLLEEMGKLDEALAIYDRALALTPDAATLLANRGNLLLSLNRAQEALASMARVTMLEPGNAGAWFNHAIALMSLGRYGQALASCDRALAIRPDFTAALNNRGTVLRRLERFEEALAAFDSALTLDPGNGAARFNRAVTLQVLRRYDEALAGFDSVLAAEPDHVAALATRGYLLWDRFRRQPEAVHDLERAVALNPDADYALGDLLHLKMLGGDWRGFDAQKALMDEGVRAGKKIIRPFAYAALTDSPRDLQLCTEIYTKDAFAPQPALWRGGAPRHRKIRLAYLCGAFSRHAHAYLAAGLYESHDRDEFEVIALDSGRNDNSAIRGRLVNAFDKFLPISDLSDAAAAQMILDEEIDILVNVDGYSGNMRMGVFARRPAPVQVNWLGYPGTLGADYMDYIIADRVVIADPRFYNERVVLMPHAYQINDAKRAIAPPGTTRKDHGLPDSAFVFCNHNQSYKLTPDVFASFLRLLKAVPGSVLWLLETNLAFHGNLKRAAEAGGVAASRLIFAPVMVIEDHLARLRLADLFLDTLPYNAHTTCSDALWAGLPLLTLPGETFAARVAASLLTVMGLPELVAENRQDFEARALALAGDKARLAAVKAKIEKQRAANPLFDTGLYCRHIESAYRTMWQISQAGEKPRGFAVPP